MTDALSQAEACLLRRDLRAAALHFDNVDQQTSPADRVDAGLWQMHMLAGEFEQAWQATDRIRARGGHDPHRFWTGEAMNGREIIVRSLHGLGDAVQMFRYAPMLKEVSKRTTWQVPPNLVELASMFRGVNHVITWEEPCRWDLQVEITELPYVFRTTLPQLPLATGYLVLPRAPSGRSRPRIGLVWAAGVWNQGRSVPLSALECILNVGGCDLVSLQGGENPEADARLETIEPGLVSLATAVAGMDLVITVDTLAAHLAGALDVPTFVLLEYAADWRWMVGRDASPWYPSLRLFRQPAPGDWETPVRAIRKALDTLKR